MLVERREFHCRACGHIERLCKDSSEPKICPACGINKEGKLYGSYSQSNEMENKQCKK